MGLWVKKGRCKGVGLKVARRVGLKPRGPWGRRLMKGKGKVLLLQGGIVKVMLLGKKAREALWDMRGGTLRLRGTRARG
jgi:hypothetical protein